MLLEILEKARRAVDVAQEKQASDILLLDTKEICSYADYLIIMSAESERQMESIVQDLDDALRGKLPYSFRREGQSESGWILIDIGGVVVHLFLPEERDYYGLEKIWGRANPLLRIQ